MFNKLKPQIHSNHNNSTLLIFLIQFLNLPFIKLLYLLLLLLLLSLLLFDLGDEYKIWIKRLTKEYITLPNISNNIEHWSQWVTIEWKSNWLNSDNSLSLSLSLSLSRFFSFFFLFFYQNSTKTQIFNRNEI